MVEYTKRALTLLKGNDILEMIDKSYIPPTWLIKPYKVFYKDGVHYFCKNH